MVSVLGKQAPNNIFASQLKLKPKFHKEMGTMFQSKSKKIKDDIISYMASLQYKQQTSNGKD